MIVSKKFSKSAHLSALLLPLRALKFLKREPTKEEKEKKKQKDEEKLKKREERKGKKDEQADGPDWIVVPGGNVVVIMCACLSVCTFVSPTVWIRLSFPEET